MRRLIFVVPILALASCAGQPTETVLERGQTQCKKSALSGPAPPYLAENPTPLDYENARRRLATELRGHADRSRPEWFDECVRQYVRIPALTPSQMAERQRNNFVADFNREVWFQRAAQQSLYPNAWRGRR